MPILQLIDYIPGQPVPAGKAAVDAPNHRIVLSPDDIPAEGATLEITIVTVFVRASATNLEVAAQIAEAERNGSDGIIELLIKDESIVTLEAAAQRAASELALKSQPNFTVNIDTRVSGFDADQQLPFIDPVAGINVLLIIQSVASNLEATVGFDDEFRHSITASIYLLSLEKILASAFSLSTLPPRTRLTQIEAQ